MSEVDPELLSVFRDEVAVAVEDMARILDGLATAGASERASLLNVAFRTVHNIKGAARIAGQSSLELLAHTLESGLDLCRKEHGELSEAFQQQLRRGMSTIFGVADGALGEDAAFMLVDEILGETTPGKGSAPPSRGENKPPSTHKPLSTERRDLQAMVRVRTDRLVEITRFAGQISMMRGSRENNHAELLRLQDVLAKARGAANGGVRPILDEARRALGALLQRDQHDLRRLGHFAAELGTAIRTLQMQPLLDLAPLARTTVTELAHELGKQVRLAVDLGGIELDREILDNLRDPLMHLLRNAVDHGLEAPAERAAAGKLEEGVVTLAARASGTMVEIEVRDDGRGFDVERIRRHAVEAGFLDAARQEEMADDEILDLIFAPGFSTASTVSRVSGRGVGLDVVRDRVEALRGHVTAFAPSGGGTAFSITVPASAVSTRGLVVRTSHATYALPIASVDGSLRVASRSVQTGNGAPAIERAGREPLKLAWLAHLMGEQRGPDGETLVVVAVSAGRSKLGLVVHEVVGETELITKSLPWNVRSVRGVAGVATLDDATLALVVDVADLVQMANDAPRERGGTVIRAPVRRTPRILVVDDSLTSRTLERNVLGAAGYEVEVAVDGQAGWELLRSKAFDLVISDVDMPRLDGIALTQRIRGDKATERTPVILVTSLDRPGDIAAGSSAGADEYLVKGRFEQRTLLEAVARLL